MYQVFVYGTLKKGFRNHKILLNNSKFICKAKTTKEFTLVHLDYPFNYFPGMIMYKSENGVYGEIYNVSDVQLKHLDQYEGTEFGLFTRLTINLELDEENTKLRSVYAYLYNRPLNCCKLIKSGLWEENINIKDLPYFRE